MNQSNLKIKNITIIAVLSAIAYLVMFAIRLPIVPAASFLKYDPKDVIIIIGGFIFGPLTAFAMSAVVSFLEMITVSTTGFIGLLMNIISSCGIACTASFIYKKKRTVAGAIIGLAVGVIVTTALMLLWNYLITPIYMTVPRETIAKMLIPVFLPFNLLKSCLNAGITLAIYKPLSTALKKMNVLPNTTPEKSSGVSTAKSKKINIGVLCAALFVIITCILIMLVYQGRILII